LAEILVVDDESSMRFLLRMTFELAGHHVSEAADGVAAVEQVEGGRLPALVATDFMMPRMNGGELIARLRRNPETAPIPIILVSSSPGSENRTDADAFFRKPFNPESLTQCVTQLLEKRA
jgi:CheY-like chemotaxis protein